MHEIERRLYVAAQVRELDRRAIEGCGIPGYTLMQRAAAAAWRTLGERVGCPQRVVVICGPGNNGGDGYELAVLAQADGARVEVLHVGALPQTGDAGRACQAWQSVGGSLNAFDGDLPKTDWVVDALYGTGLSRAPDGAAAAAIEAMVNARTKGAHVLAVDVPSGLDASTGEVPGVCVEADLTVSFIGNKLGLWTGRGPAVAGQRYFDALQVPDAVHDNMAPDALLQVAHQLQQLGRRARDAHKGQSGHVLVVGGNHGMAGAAVLAGRAALRAGAGLVSLATRPEHVAIAGAVQPELMAHGVDAVAQLAPLLERADVVALGPGLGQDAWARALFAHVLTAGRPMVVDADALNLLARLPRQNEQWILTPHPGEAARLLQCSVAEVQADRRAAAMAIRRQFGGAVVLKGAGSLIAGSTTVEVCPFGNPGMGVAGMGDTLTGIVAALRAQGFGVDAAAALGVLVHARAGDRAASAGERGLLPSDLLLAIRAEVNP